VVNDPQPRHGVRRSNVAQGVALLPALHLTLRPPVTVHEDHWRTLCPDDESFHEEPGREPTCHHRFHHFARRWHGGTL